MRETRTRQGRALIALATLSLAAACDRPEAPRIRRDLARVDGTEYTSPHIPPNRTSADGRVTINVQGGPSHLAFSLFVPEKLDAPLLESGPGRRILATTTPYLVPFDPEPHEILGHHGLCDPTTEMPRPGERTNPYPCGPGDARDCYDLTVINSAARDGGARLWGTPATVEVSAPKTAAARIVDVRLGQPVAGTFIANTPEWTETMVTTDGRLLTGRVNSFPRRWTNPETGEELVQLYDILYSVLPESAEPCDVTGWTRFHPISHAPFDPEMKGRYGIAAYPFRDGEGNLVPDGHEIGGTYPWVDREGTNLFLSGVPERLVDTPAWLYPRRCVSEGCEAFEESTGWQKGLMVAGLWTHGKMVLLDGLINHTDWAPGVDPAAHRIVTLYAGDGPTSEVQVGAGRMSSGVRFPEGFGGNANILDSLQNLMNERRAMRPTTPRDVVWLMSTGAGTDEIVFDDYVNPDAFIVSNMQASVTRELGLATPPQYYAKVRYGNGATHGWLGATFDADIHVQNAATALPARWRVPAYGRMAAGTGRIEPVAMGGLRGKGLWLDGTNRVEYAIPRQPRDVRAHDWYIGIAVDRRDASGSERTLLSFPDGTGLVLAGERTLMITRGGAKIASLLLPDALDDGWTHIGIDLPRGGERARLFHDGYLLADGPLDGPIFQMLPGTLVVGDDGSDPRPGFRGWIDDFLVIAQRVDLEVACNHAYGTLLRVDPESPLDEQASRYPAFAHAAVHAAAGAGAGSGPGRYACYHDHGRDHGVLGELPEGTASVRAAIHFPEGPLRFGEPRPDSSRNPFCLSCHHANGQGGLGLAALEARPGVTAENDPRRQPLQPLRRVFGNVPARWIEPGPGPGGPEEALRAPAEGLLVDRWVLP